MKYETYSAPKRVCSKCQEAKFWCEFPKRGNMCKECVKARNNVTELSRLRNNTKHLNCRFDGLFSRDIGR